jgi:hypothetical protein
MADSKKTQRLWWFYPIIALLAWLLNTGWLFADGQNPDHFHLETRQRNVRHNSAMAIAIGGAFATIWPIGVPLAYLASGYAEGGWKAPWNLEVE